MSENKATLTVGGETKDYAVMDGSVGPQVIDVRKLYANTGMFTYDPGFTSTASCESGLTYIDGDEGVLLHRKARGFRSRRKPAMRLAFAIAIGRPRPAAFRIPADRRYGVEVSTQALAEFRWNFDHRASAPPSGARCGRRGAPRLRKRPCPRVPRNLPSSTTICPR